MRKLEQELNNLVYPKQDELRGSLGISESVVKVTTRPGWDWVRLLDNPSELIKAHNSKTAHKYDLPVVVRFNGRGYEIVGVDTGRYAVWQSESSFLPSHGPTHSAMRGAEGEDIVWVDGQQFLPLLVIPNDISGSQSVLVNNYSYLNSHGDWRFVGGTGVYNLVPVSPPESTIYLIMMNDISGELYCITGSNFSGISGTYSILSNLPSVPTYPENVPIAGVVSTPNQAIGWRDIYDVRQFVSAPNFGATGTLSSYDSGWFAISEGQAITKNHNLGTQQLVITTYVDNNSNGSTGQLDYGHTEPNVRFGPRIRLIDNNSFKVVMGDGGYLKWDDSGVTTRIETNIYVRIIATTVF